MFTPTNACTGRMVSCCLRVLVVLSLLLETLPFTGAGTALAAPAAKKPTADGQSTLPQAPPSEDPGFPGDDSFGTIPPPPDPPTTLPITPTLPVYLELRVEQYLLTPGATATLTVTIYSQAEPQTPAALLALALPTGLETVGGQTGTLTWPVPA